MTRIGIGIVLLSLPCANPAGAQSAPKSIDQAALELEIREALAADSPRMAQPRLLDRGERPRYRLRRGDELELTFELAPDFDQTLRVFPDGFMALKGVDDLHVEGAPLHEVQSAIEQRYKTIFRDPRLALTLIKFEEPYFIAFGELKTSGKYPLTGRTSVTQALGIAGGLSDRAKHKQVLLFRPLDDSWIQVKDLNVKKMLSKADLSEDLFLQPGDIIYVPRRMMSKIKELIPRPGIGLGFGY